jgi:hypothetical protein
MGAVLEDIRRPQFAHCRAKACIDAEKRYPVEGEPPRGSKRAVCPVLRRDMHTAAMPVRAWTCRDGER